ncbi:MAG: penicillin acylase family protein [Chitinophagaceae bacterium]|nr:MAG: penicillin acylase family protein [Chitinophagaceae bacterium]
MRVIPTLISAAITIGLVYFLNHPFGSKVPMPLGSFLSPQTGFWQNASPEDENFSALVQNSALIDSVNVYLDERLVPHVFAQNDEDLYFVQGYLHAKFRLFQMDLQTLVAEGRASEVAGKAALNLDRENRRLGMRFAAENTLKEVEKDASAIGRYSAYTKGVNAYIKQLTKSELPLEYKILNFKPGEWSNLRTMLLLKMMAKNLAYGTQHDVANTAMKNVFGLTKMDILYPQVNDSLLPIVPKGTMFDKPIVLNKPVLADSVYLNAKIDLPFVNEENKPNPNNGSNNWVVAGSKTKSGVPILCNDPHLEMSLPSIWYEMQLTTPNSNAYGVSIPGSPYIIIGLNDSISWGVTNSQRDVLDFFSTQFKDDTKKEYWYNNQWKSTDLRIETIKIKGEADFIDTVAYTVFGPVMYDKSFVADSSYANAALSAKWVAHHTGDDGEAFYKLNRAKNYREYLNAIKTYECPGQNFVFASKTGDIAIWQQGKFPARWKGQGDYIMPGQDSTYDWQAFIPQEQNPHAFNPARGFLESGNQRPVDGSYPYYIPGSYITPRGIAIEEKLGAMNQISVDDMKALQSNYYNVLAHDMVPLMLQNIEIAQLENDAKTYLEYLKEWDFNADPNSKAQTVYQIWMNHFMEKMYLDEFEKMGKDSLVLMAKKTYFPSEQTTMELLKRDSTAAGTVDDKSTSSKIETLKDIMTASLKTATVELNAISSENKLEWTKYKDVSVFHLLKKALIAFARTGLNVGGWSNTINAVTQSHGPSWRMIVHMTKEAEAYGVYPGGQNGNPGSKFYDDYVDIWANGKYNKLWMMKANEAASEQVKWTLQFKK